jgi:hypothetical protein
MRLYAGLFCTVAQILTVKANVEKTIFLGPSPAVLPNVDHSPEKTQISWDSLSIDVLDPKHFSLLPTWLRVQFPSETAPRGLESWYKLQDLEDGRRYEVRICWPATVSSSLLFHPSSFLVCMPAVLCNCYASCFVCS